MWVEVTVAIGRLMPIKWSPQIEEKELQLIGNSLILCDGHVIHLWRKSTRGVVTDEPYSDLLRTMERM